jgi:hypothetical protein
MKPAATPATLRLSLSRRDCLGFLESLRRVDGLWWSIRRARWTPRRADLDLVLAGDRNALAWALRAGRRLGGAIGVAV